MKTAGYFNLRSCCGKVNYFFTVLTPCYVSFFAFIFTIGLCPFASAANWHATVETTTDLPVQVGAKLVVEGPFRFRLSTTLGVLPGPYVSLINSVVVAAGGYDQNTADLVRSSLKNSMIWRLHFGWRPFSKYGFYFEAGYGLAALGGGVTGEELITLATGLSPPSSSNSKQEYDVKSILHMIDIEIGWRWVVWKGLTIHTAIGFAGTLGSNTSVSPDFQPRTNKAKQAVDRFCIMSADYLRHIYTSYIFTPIISLGLGWRF